MKLIKRILKAIVNWLREPDLTRERFEELESKKYIRRGG